MTNSADGPLPGGTANRGLVVRVGATVRQPTAPCGRATHALLAHLASVGFDGPPRVLATDAETETLTYMEGRAAVPPLSEDTLSDAALVSIADLLRRYHQAVRTFDPVGHQWPRPVPSRFTTGLISHNDVHPANLVFRDGRAVALIDFDLAGPGSAAWDIATAIRSWAPTGARCSVASWGEPGMRRVLTVVLLFPQSRVMATRGRVAMNTTVLGYPRIGADRELKKATESYWAGRIDAGELDRVSATIRRQTWETLRDAGLTTIPSNTFSLYDHVLDTAVLFGAVPERFAGRSGLDAYFAMARGADGVQPLEMTKWLDTNYHYLVPELEPGTSFRLAGTKPLDEYLEARDLGMQTRPVLVGPLSFLLLAKPFRPELLDSLLDAYTELLARLAGAGVREVQLDEPVLAADRGDAELALLKRCYERLGDLTERPKLLVSTYFGEIGGALPVLAASGVEAIGLDLVAGPGNVRALAGVGGLPAKTLVAGLVDGRNVWRTDLTKALATGAALLGLAGDVTVSTSCSLLHVPLDTAAETRMDPDLRDRLAFARQKVDEVVLIGRALSEGREAVAGELEAAEAARTRFASRADGRVRARLEALGAGASRRDHSERFAAQRSALNLPPLATTTIGSFPQTEQIRKARAAHRAGRISDASYDEAMRAEIDRVIALQEDIGLDVLVHGEPERNDMVQYFAERLDGYAATENGWVQSYGTRCVRPPILFGDVNRPEPITVGWATHAQSRTTKPVKGMLTGPVTMLAWSFVRDDQPLADTAGQVALALRDEIRDLESAGIGIIQVDEPALRELLPLRRADHEAYLAWAVGAFRLATSGVAESTQIHTHMCYSEFGEIIGAIGDLDADVTSVEAARSHMELLTDLERAGYRRGIGPGVYDIHSPRVPGIDEMENALRRALETVEPGRLWVNPDCGLKTRGYEEVEPALRNLVAAAHRVRETPAR